MTHSAGKPVPPKWLAWGLALALVVLWGALRLVMFGDQFFPLTFVLPLLICVWTRSRAMVWTMALVFIVMASVEFLLILPQTVTVDDAVRSWAVTLFNVLLGAVVVDAVVAQRLRLEAAYRQIHDQNGELEAQSEELAQQNEELAQQNEELAQQSEELTQTCEELAEKADELEFNNQKLQSKSAEVESLNSQLSRREELLQVLLEADRLQGSEENVLQEVTRAGAALFQGIGPVVISELREGELVPLAGSDEEGQALSAGAVRCPFEFSRLVLAEGRVAALDDAELRPDLPLPELPGRPRFRAVLTAPFASGGQGRGTISVLSGERREWTEQDFLLVAWLAGQCGRALASMRLNAALRESEGRFRLMADELPFIVWVHDGEGNLSFINRTYRLFFGVTDEEVFEDGWQAVIHPEDADRYVEGFATAVRNRTVFHEQARVRDASGEWRWIDSVGVPRFTEDGMFLGHIGSSPDVTERVAAEEVLRANAALAAALTGIDTLLHSDLRLDDAMDEVLRRSCEVLGCDVARVLRRKSQGVWSLQYGWGTSPSEFSADVADDDVPTAMEAYRRFEVVQADDEALRHDDPLLQRDEARSLIVAPLVARDNGLGVIVFSRREHPPSFSEAQVEFARRLASNVSLALENARLYEEQSAIAMTLQRNFMHPLPEVAGLEIASVAEVAGRSELVGGDFHDILELPDGQALLFIGDVQGKGVKSSGLAERVRSAVRALALVEPSTHSILDHVNQLLLVDGTEEFVTLLLLLIDPSTGRLSVASAGHPPGVLLRSGVAERLENDAGPPLGTFEWEYRGTEISLEPGDVLVLYTDGIIEARSRGELFGEMRAAQVVATGASDLDSLVRRLRDTALAFAGAAQDDAQVLAVRYIGLSGAVSPHPRTLQLPVPHVLERLAEVRGSVRHFLQGHRVAEPAIRRTLLCLEEACTNALLHSGSDEPALLEVKLVDGSIEASVRDSGRGMDDSPLQRLIPPDAMSAGGRGLFLIEHHADEFEIVSDGGALVRFRIHLSGDGDGAARGGERVEEAAGADHPRPDAS